MSIPDAWQQPSTEVCLVACTPFAKITYILTSSLTSLDSFSELLKGCLPGYSPQ